MEEKNCHNCRHTLKENYEAPCDKCRYYSRWEDKPELKDRHQLRDELLQMYIFGIECVGISYAEYEQMKKEFMIKLGEFEQKIQEEC